MILVVIVLARVAQAKNITWRQVHVGWSIQAFLANSYVSILIMNIGVSVRPAKIELY